jgi:hypothetical protein
MRSPTPAPHAPSDIKIVHPSEFTLSEELRYLTVGWSVDLVALQITNNFKFT